VCEVSGIPGLAELQQRTLGDNRICVAVVDGPVDHGHPAFDGADFRPLNEAWPSQRLDGPTAAHGTIVASVIFGQPGGPVRGIAPACRGLSVPVFAGERPRTSQLELARGIEMAVEAGAHVINVSGGQLSASGEAEDVLARAVRFCLERNVLVVAAAGNDGCFCTHVPAALPSVLAVGALDDNGEPMAMSNWGAAYQRQGILAPGADIPGAVPGGGTTTASGTSLATPIVAGVAALLLSVQLRAGREPDPLAVGAALLSSADPCEFDRPGACARFLTGKLNIGRAVRAVTTNETELADTTEDLCGCGGVDGPEARCTCTDTAENPVPAAVMAAAAPPVPAVASSAPRVVTASAEPGAAPFQQLVYAIGSLGYDFGSEARRDSFKQQMLPQILPSVVPRIEEASLSDGIIKGAVLDGDAIRSGAIAGGVVVVAVNPGGEIVTAPINAGAIIDGTLISGDVDGDTITNAVVEGGIIVGAVVGGGPTSIKVAANPYDARQMLEHLVRRPAEASSLIWTLNLELTPIYALDPLGAYGSEVYDEFIWVLAGQLAAEGDSEAIGKILKGNPRFAERIKKFGGRLPRFERFALPGRLGGRTSRLFSGQVVPAVDVEQPRGVLGWNVADLLEHARKAAYEAEVNRIRQRNENRKKGEPEEEIPPRLTPELREKADGAVRDFLDRIYYDLRNLGATSSDRALNYSATNVFAVETIMNGSVKERLFLDTIGTEKSPYCRMDSDCWDVKLRFFDPDNNKRAKQVWRFSVDVSDVLPVLVGELRRWFES
jgi:hypothetical protein